MTGDYNLPYYTDNTANIFTTDDPNPTWYVDPNNWFIPTSSYSYPIWFNHWCMYYEPLEPDYDDPIHQKELLSGKELYQCTDKNCHAKLWYRGVPSPIFFDVFPPENPLGTNTSNAP